MTKCHAGQPAIAYLRLRDFGPAFARHGDMPYRPCGRVSEGAWKAFATCAELAEEHTHASGSGPYADGFRAAAHQIAHQISTLRSGHPPTPLERDLRDAEVEARTLARVVLAAERLVDELDDPEAARALGALLGGFFAPHELPEKLRADTSSRSIPIRVMRKHHAS